MRWVPAPDAYRVDWAAAGSRSLGEWFAAQVQDAIDDLAAQRHPLRRVRRRLDLRLRRRARRSAPASSRRCARSSRRAGGVYLADEVQPGFGRTGDTMWGFERHGTRAAPFVPDLVTIGKPMGNGMPIAATIMRPEVVEEFARDMRYFNTFGGNAVSIAAAQAVLDVVRDEGLQDNARVVGDALQASLRELAGRHPCIGDVRGAGLFVGVESRAGDDGEPDEDLALARRQRAARAPRARRHRRDLTTTCSRCARRSSSPQADAERFVTELDATLADARLTAARDGLIALSHALRRPLRARPPEV